MTQFTHKHMHTRRLNSLLTWILFLFYAHFFVFIYAFFININYTFIVFYSTMLKLRCLRRLMLPARLQTKSNARDVGDPTTTTTTVTTTTDYGESVQPNVPKEISILTQQQNSDSCLAEWLPSHTHTHTHRHSHTHADGGERKQSSAKDVRCSCFCCCSQFLFMLLAWKRSRSRSHTHTCTH